MTRKDAREFMMQTFFQMEACNDFDVNSKAKYFEGKKMKKEEKFCEELFSLMCNKKEEVDKLIEEHSTGWKLDRMPKTDLAIVRLAICEILYMEDIPAAVSINEAVELAKSYGTEDSSAYVNAILGKIESVKNL